MISEQTRVRALRARHLYEQQFQQTLESLHHGWFVALEPDSGDHFLAETFDAAADAAQAAYPDRQSHVLRIGHRAALHIGLIANS
jgi:hypothetical protein